MTEERRLQRMQALLAALLVLPGVVWYLFLRTPTNSSIPTVQIQIPDWLTAILIIVAGEFIADLALASWRHFTERKRDKELSSKIEALSDSIQLLVDEIRGEREERKKGSTS